MTHVSLDGMVGIAAGNGFQAPGPADFEFPDIFNGNQVLLAKSSLLLVLGAIVVAAFFLITTRRLRIVPSKSQYFSEEAYSFVRNGIAQDIIGGRDYMRFVPLLTTMFFFILVNNLFGLVPFLQFAPFSRAGFAYALAGMVWVVYNGVGIARHGFFPYLKLQTVPPGVPAWILPLLSATRVPVQLDHSADHAVPAVVRQHVRRPPAADALRHRWRVPAVPRHRLVPCEAGRHPVVHPRHPGRILGADRLGSAGLRLHPAYRDVHPRFSSSRALTMSQPTRIPGLTSRARG